MPSWLQAINHVNPLSYEVEALRGLLIGTAARLPLDFAVTIGWAVLGVACAAALLPRLTR
jgi:ABC-2 type transport system permease protein